jgi:hypothetical protein
LNLAIVSAALAIITLGVELGVHDVSRRCTAARA